MQNSLYQCLYDTITSVFILSENFTVIRKVHPSLLDTLFQKVCFMVWKTALCDVTNGPH